MNYKNCNCDYCINPGFIWILPKNIIWIEIPKNGSTSLKASYCTQRKIIKPQNILKYNNGFVILRDPISRFKSLLAHFFIDGHRAACGKKWLKLIGFDGAANGNICDIVLDNIDKLDRIDANHHFNSQVSFIPYQFYKLQNIEFLDCMDLYKKTKTKINNSSSNNIFVSEENKSIIETIYKHDMILYKKEILDKV